MTRSYICCNEVNLWEHNYSDVKWDPIARNVESPDEAAASICLLPSPCPDYEDGCRPEVIE